MTIEQTRKQEPIPDALRNAPAWAIRLWEAGMPMPLVAAIVACFLNREIDQEAWMQKEEEIEAWFVMRDKLIQVARDAFEAQAKVASEPEEVISDAPKGY